AEIDLMNFLKLDIVAVGFANRAARSCRLAALLFSLAPTSAGWSTDLIGQACIIDGDTRGTRIRLSGIDAPESTQLCRGEDSLQYRCGAKAPNDLTTFVARRPVSCIPTSLDQYGRTVATRSVGG